MENIEGVVPLWCFSLFFPILKTVIPDIVCLLDPTTDIIHECCQIATEMQK